MRRLGARLDVEAMSLYRYVNGREDLLEAVVDALVHTIEIPAVGQLQPVDGWQAFLQVIAHDVRRLAHDHPAAFPLIATRHPAAPWLRPPLRSLRLVEGFLSGLEARGFTEEPGRRRLPLVHELPARAPAAPVGGARRRPCRRRRAHR